MGKEKTIIAIINMFDGYIRKKLRLLSPDWIELRFVTIEEALKDDVDYVIYNDIDRDYYNLFKRSDINNFDYSKLVIYTDNYDFIEDFERCSREHYLNYNKEGYPYQKIYSLFDIWFKMDRWHIEQIQSLMFMYQRFLQKIEEKWVTEIKMAVHDVIFENQRDLIWVKDLKGNHQMFSDSFLKALPVAKDGHKKTKEECLSKGHLFLWELSEEEYDAGDFVCMESEEQVINANKTFVFDEKLKIGDSDEIRDLSTIKAPLRNKRGQIIGTVGMARDVTTEIQYKNLLEKNAYTDALTGLYNRRYIYDYLQAHNNSNMVILFMDLDKFKKVNDNYGHSKGDGAY